MTTLSLNRKRGMCNGGEWGKERKYQKSNSFARARGFNFPFSSPMKGSECSILLQKPSEGASKRFTQHKSVTTILSHDWKYINIDDLPSEPLWAEKKEGDKGRGFRAAHKPQFDKERRLHEFCVSQMDITEKEPSWSILKAMKRVWGHGLVREWDTGKSKIQNGSSTRTPASTGDPRNS